MVRSEAVTLTRGSSPFPKQKGDQSSLYLDGGLLDIILKVFLPYNLFHMLTTLLNVIIILAIIGWITGYAIFNIGSGLIHLLLIIAVIAVLIRLIQGRPPLG